MKILITGVAGFIGFNIAEHLLKNKNKVFGLDNFDRYYSIALKKKRLSILNKNKNFSFSKIDIINRKSFNNFFKNKKIDMIIHLAAQAGVRYSFINPGKYIDTNIFGFLNVIHEAKKNKIKNIMYASSSSVYGENKNFPLKENEKLNPKNIYAVSKKLSEEMAEMYQKISDIKFVGLRFFTVYGEWGRPDMMMLKFINCFFKKKVFELYNYGKHERDFTYIGDVVNILKLLIKNHKKLPDNDLFNICSNKPIKLEKIISIMKINGVEPKIKKMPLQQADILKTHGDNSKLLKYIKYREFADWKDSLKKTINWYKEFMIK